MLQMTQMSQIFHLINYSIEQYCQKRKLRLVNQCSDGHCLIYSVLATIAAPNTVYQPNNE